MKQIIAGIFVLALLPGVSAAPGPVVAEPGQDAVVQSSAMLSPHPVWCSIFPWMCK